MAHVPHVPGIRTVDAGHAACGATAVWAEACLPPVPLGPLAMPGVGSTVWVQFEGGDRDRPVWAGIVWETAVVVDRSITSATSVTVRVPVVNVEAGMARFDGVVRCQALIAESVVASSCTPGAGNIS